MKALFTLEGTHRQLGHSTVLFCPTSNSNHNSQQNLSVHPVRAIITPGIISIIITTTNKNTSRTQVGVLTKRHKQQSTGGMVRYGRHGPSISPLVGPDSLPRTAWPGFRRPLRAPTASSGQLIRDAQPTLIVLSGGAVQSLRRKSRQHTLPPY